MNGVGTLTGDFNVQPPHTVFAGPNSGITSAQPTFRPLVATDIPSALSLTMLGVSGTTLLGTNTTCIHPLLPSCYDISNQACFGGALSANCIPSSLHLTNLVVDNLIVVNGSISVDYVNSSFFGDVTVNGTTPLVCISYISKHLIGTLSCTGNGSVSNGCLNLGGYTCPVGVPLADSCIPATLAFLDLSVTNTLNVVGPLVTCGGGTLTDMCIPDRVKTINGVAPTASPALDFTLAGTANQVILTPGTSSITFSLPQSINVAATPTVWVLIFWYFLMCRSLGRNH